MSWLGMKTRFRGMGTPILSTLSRMKAMVMVISFLGFVRLSRI
jgi:hypothetical protein